jgi:peptidoglycan lytic transglycosylase G
VKRVVIWLLLLVVVVVGAFAVWVALGAVQPYKGYTADEQFVDIPPGSGPGAIGRRLADAGVIRDRLTFRIELLRSGAGRRLQAGEYRFDRPMTLQEVIAKIARGDVYLLPITFREGLTIREMAALYESKGFGSASEFITAASDARAVHEFDQAARDLEGYLFPDTYSVPRQSTAAQLVARMVAGFQKVLTPELQTEAARRGMTIRELVTFASIVEKETGKPDERPLVAAVYANRLKIGMGLQCDPTVIYALQRVNRYDGNLTRESLQFDSPYNTYRYRGLPPGPIAAPGRASLDAAAHPADVSYLYFVSRGDGSHVFATTLEEHNHNVYEFQKKPYMRLP